MRVEDTWSVVTFRLHLTWGLVTADLTCLLGSAAVTRERGLSVTQRVTCVVMVVMSGHGLGGTT